MHDSDAHLMEPPDFLARHADPRLQEHVNDLWIAGRADFASQAVAQMRAMRTEPGYLEQATGDLLMYKNWWALGAFDPSDRALALDRLGFSSQLVFATHARAVMVDQPGRPPTAQTDPVSLYATITAYNRAAAEFCACDPRLLAVGFVALDDPVAALRTAEQAVALGCAAVEMPVWPPAGRSPAHVDHEPVFAVLAEAGVPIVFHIGSGGSVPPPEFANTGRERRVDPLGNYEPMRPLRVVGTPAPVELTLSALLFEGVLERHPGLRIGVMEHGATWVPSFLRRIDLAADLDAEMQGADEPWGPLSLPLRPSEYVRRQVRFSPFPQEDVGALIEQSSPELYMFSSDYPHAEGGQHPLESFDASLARLGDRADDVADRFYRRNFEEFIGRSLPA